MTFDGNCVDENYLQNPFLQSRLNGHFYIKSVFVFGNQRYFPWWEYLGALQSGKPSPPSAETRNASGRDPKTLGHIHPHRIHHIQISKSSAFIPPEAVEDTWSGLILPLIFIPILFMLQATFG